MDKKRDAFFLSEKKQSKDNKQDKKQNKDNGQEKAKINFKLQHKHKKQQNFDKSRNELDKEEKTAGEKKPFDKKAYRLKKYSKKYKLEQWEEQRKKKLLRNYYKDIKSENLSGSYKPITFDEDKTDSNDEIGKYVRHPDLMKEESTLDQNKIKKDPFFRAKQQYNKIQQEKLVKRQEMEKLKEEKNQKIEEYKKKKQEKFKKLCKKTKKGQPVMTGRMELLLEKIQMNAKNTK